MHTHTCIHYENTFPYIFLCNQSQAGLLMGAVPGRCSPGALENHHLILGLLSCMVTLLQGTVRTPTSLHIISNWVMPRGQPQKEWALQSRFCPCPHKAGLSVLHLAWEPYTCYQEQVFLAESTLPLEHPGQGENSEVGKETE